LRENRSFFARKEKWASQTPENDGGRASPLRGPILLQWEDICSSSSVGEGGLAVTSRGEPRLKSRERLQENEEKRDLVLGQGRGRKTRAYVYRGTSSVPSQGDRGADRLKMVCKKVRTQKIEKRHSGGESRSYS